MTRPPRNPQGFVRLIAVVSTFAYLYPANAQAQPRSPSAVPSPSPYFHSFATASLGESLRFNNPYRLPRALGSSDRSISLTPPYANLGAAAFLGSPNRWQHGLAVQWSRALSGLPQHVITTSYALLYGGLRPWLLFSRLGLPVVLNPDTNVGTEAAVGGAYLITAGLGIQAELIGNLFYGAATWDTGQTTIPMLSLQAGLIADLEVLP